MIRFGMNKKSADPVNEVLPFYYVENGKYIPTSNMFITGPSRSFYRPKAEGLAKIVWMETDSAVTPYTELDISKIKSYIHIDKDKIINQQNNPCCIDNQIYCNEFDISGPCALIYYNNVYPSIRIIAMGIVTVIN